MAQGDVNPLWEALEKRVSGSDGQGGFGLHMHGFCPLYKGSQTMSHDFDKPCVQHHGKHLKTRFFTMMLPCCALMGMYPKWMSYLGTVLIHAPCAWYSADLAYNMPEWRPELLTNTPPDPECQYSFVVSACSGCFDRVERSQTKCRWLFRIVPPTYVEVVHYYQRSGGFR